MSNVIYTLIINMKKIAVLLFILSFVNICVAQTPQSVLGINLKTTMTKFKQNLAKRGYKPSQTAEGVYEYKVTYAGYPNCRMEVRYYSGNDSIRLLTVYFPHESYSKDQSIYNNMTRQFKEKYGNEVDWSGGILGAINKGHKMKSYGELKINLCTVSWYYDDDEEDDGVRVQYNIFVEGDSKVSVSSDI